MSRQRIRSVNFTPQEVILLVDIVIKYIEILESKQADAIMWKQKNQTWNTITNEFNEHNKTVQRDRKTLRLKYDCLKREVKNKIMKIKTKINDVESGDKEKQLLIHEEKLAKALNIEIKREGNDNESVKTDIKIKIENDFKEKDETNQNDRLPEKSNAESNKNCTPVETQKIPLVERIGTYNIENISKCTVHHNRCLAQIQIENALKTKEYINKKIECLNEEHELTIKKLKLEIQEKQLMLLSNYCLEDY